MSANALAATCYTAIAYTSIVPGAFIHNQSRSELMQMVQTNWRIHTMSHVCTCCTKTMDPGDFAMPALGNASLSVPSLALWLDNLLKYSSLLWQAHHQAA